MFTVKQIKEMTKGTLINGCLKRRVSGISIDTRSLKKGDAFVAIQGVYQDGHEFIPKAIEQGAALLIVSKGSFKGIPKDMAVICVEDTTESLGQIAKVYRKRFQIPVIAVTGSAGKTTTKDLIAQVLSTKFRVLKNHASFNNQWGVPLTILNMRPFHQAAVIEIGTNAPGEIERLARIVQPTVAVFTNIGPAHLKGLGSVEKVYKEKICLLKALKPKGMMIFNGDDLYLKRLKGLKKFRKLSYGTNGESSIQLNLCCLNKRGIFEGVMDRSLKLKLHTPVLENMKNALAAVACGRLLGLSAEQILTSLSKFRFSNSRQFIERISGITLINDTYNANPLSFKSAIQTLASIPAKGKRIAVCADMLELGKMSRSLHQEIGRFLAEHQVDVVLTYGPYARFIALEYDKYKAQGCVQHYRHIIHIGKKLVSLCEAGDVVLVKGSRSMRTERVVEYLKSNLK